MITEDYCSYEVAKLLKEKGFDKFNTYGWDEKLFDKEHPRNFSISFDNKEYWISCPTHQMAMAWLREEHEIDIIPIIRHSLKYAQESPFRDYACRVYDCDGNIILSATKWYSRYENAVEAALKYCLENLI